ncbi:MAG: hypothetical protein ISS01_01040 [Nanoarchaeota archaeon]|nr:hypothetical protein [Nanoarchaeota archaeon]
MYEGDLVQNYAEGEILDRSLEEILSLEREGTITKTNALRMETLVKYSSYGQVYAASILDPSLKDRLEHNVRFRKEAKEYGIDVDKWHEGIEDKEPLRLKLEKAARLERDKIYSYLKEAFEIIEEFKEKSSMSFEYYAEEFTHVDYEELVETYYEGNYPQFLNSLFGYTLIEESEERYIEILEELETEIGLEQDSFFMSHDERKATIDQILPKLVESDKDKFEKDLELRIKERLERINLLVCYENWQERKEIEHEGKLDSLLKSLRNLVESSYSSNSFYKKVLNIFENGDSKAVLNDYSYVVVYDFDVMKIHNLISHISEIEDPNLISSRVKKVAEVEYTCQVEELLPKDISFGNDGGCCIAANICNTRGDLGNSNYIPFYQLDDATIVIGIYQKAVLSRSKKELNRKKRRVGMLLVHAGINLENRAVQGVNSLELSSAMNPLSNKPLKELTNNCLRYVDQLGIESGFEGLVMGNHYYNTAINYLPTNLTLLSTLIDQNNKGEIIKLPDYVAEGKQRWYSEIFDKHGNSREKTIVWIRKPGEENILE